MLATAPPSAQRTLARRSATAHSDSSLKSRIRYSTLQSGRHELLAAGLILPVSHRLVSNAMHFTALGFEQLFAGGWSVSQANREGGGTDEPFFGGWAGACEADEQVTHVRVQVGLSICCVDSISPHNNNLIVQCLQESDPTDPYEYVVTHSAQ